MKAIPLLLLVILRSLLQEKEMMQPFVHLSIVFYLYSALQNRRSKFSNFFAFHTSGGISSIPIAFLFLVFQSTSLSSSWVKCPSLMSSWLLMIFVIGLFVTLKEFPRRFLKYSFHISICFSWQVAFSLTFEELFLFLTSFTVCHAILDCLSSAEFYLFYWSDFDCFLFILFGMCKLVPLVTS